MIVVDENIARQSVLAGLRWYEGKVVPLKALHPATVIKDDAIPSLLIATHGAKAANFRHDGC